MYYSTPLEDTWALKEAIVIIFSRYFQYHCTESGRRLGGYLCNAWCTALEYDEKAKYAFIGDYSGQITVCRLEEAGVHFINCLKGHNGSIQDITWDGIKGWLYTGKHTGEMKFL